MRRHRTARAAHPMLERRTEPSNLPEMKQRTRSGGWKSVLLPSRLRIGCCDSRTASSELTHETTSCTPTYTVGALCRDVVEL